MFLRYVAVQTCSCVFKCDNVISSFLKVETQATTARCSKRASWGFKQAVEVVVDWSESEHVCACHMSLSYSEITLPIRPVALGLH